MYKLIAQWTTKVDMINMYRIRKEFSYYYYLMVSSAIHYLSFLQFILLLNFANQYILTVGEPNNDGQQVIQMWLYS